MIKNNLKRAAIALAALAGLSPLAANAASFAIGDLFLAVDASAGTGVTETLVVNLGAASGYRDSFDNGIIQLNFRNIGTQLSTQFGSGWADRTDLRMHLYGATGADSIGDDLLNGDPFQTAYVGRGTRATTESAIAATSQNVASAGALQTASSRINAAAGSYGNAAVIADSAGVGIIPNSLANSPEEFLRPTVSSSFGAWGSGVDQTFAAGNRGTTFPGIGPVGTVEGFLDMYRVQNRNDIPGQYGEGTALRVGDYTGSFLLSSAGEISFVPEPGSTVMLAVTGLLALGRRRRA
jgi:hypothetical protein